MLKKLIKHEWSTVSKLLLIVHVLVILMAFMGRAAVELSGGYGPHKNPMSILGMTFLLFYILSIICVAFFTCIYLVVRFYKHILTDQGYLTNTLPVTTHQLIISKLVVGSLWFVIDFFVIIVSVAVLLFSPGEISYGFRIVLDVVGEHHLLPQILNILLNALLSIPSALLLGYAAVALGSLFTGHKALGAIGCYIGIYAVMQFITMFSMYASGTLVVTTESGQTAVRAGNEILRMVKEVRLLSENCLYQNIASIVTCVLFYGIAWWVLNHKLNLE